MVTPLGTVILNCPVWQQKHRDPTILQFDNAAVWAYGDVRAELERRGTPIGSLDTMIAAHALSLQALLLTNNTH